MKCGMLTPCSNTIHKYVANADCTCDAVQALQRMSSSLKDFTIKAFRLSRDVEVPSNIVEQQAAAPEKMKIGAKAKKLAVRFVPVALGKIIHSECYRAHHMILSTPPPPPPCPQIHKVRVFREVHMDCYAVNAEVTAAMQRLVNFCTDFVSLHPCVLLVLYRPARKQHLKTCKHYTSIVSARTLLPFVQTNLSPFASSCMQIYPTSECSLVCRWFP